MLMFMLSCRVLCCDVLCCVVMYCIVLYCTVLYYIVLYCLVLYCTVLYNLTKDLELVGLLYGLCLALHLADVVTSIVYVQVPDVQINA